MYQFITGISFELTLLVVFTLGYLILDGRIKMFIGAADFQYWRNKNGRVIKFICIITIIMLICSIIAKYLQYYSDPLPSLPT